MNIITINNSMGSNTIKDPNQETSKSKRSTTPRRKRIFQSNQAFLLCFTFPLKPNSTKNNISSPKIIQSSSNSKDKKINNQKDQHYVAIRKPTYLIQENKRFWANIGKDVVGEAGYIMPIMGISSQDQDEVYE